MRYYIIYPEECQPDHHDYRIIKVQQADEAHFLKEYASKIIVSGDSLMEAFLNFEKWKQESGQ